MGFKIRYIWLKNYSFVNKVKLYVDRAVTTGIDG